MLLSCGKCGVDHIKTKPCEMLDCLTDRRLVKKRRGLAKYRQIGGKPTGHWVFTFPGAWREALGGAQLVAIRRALAVLLDQWHDAAIDCGRRGWLVAFHPCGDPGRREKAKARAEGREPDDPARWVPHFHVSSPCAQLVDGQVMDLAAHLPLEALDDLRARWGALLDLVADVLGLDRAAANVHYRYAKDVHMRLHHLTYDHRPFTRWYGRNEKLPGATEDDARYNLPRGLRSTAAYGLLGPNSREDGLEAFRAAVAGDVADLGTEGPPTDQDVREGRACPCCRGPLELVRDSAGTAVIADYGDAQWRAWRAAGLVHLDEWNAPAVGPPARAAPPDDLPY